MTQSSSNLLRMLILIISWTSLNSGGVGLKSRSLGQIFVKSCYHSRGLNIDHILMKLAQNPYLDNISDKFEYGWVGSKSRSLGQIFVKSCYHSKGYNFDSIFIKLAQNVYFENISNKFEYGWDRVKK